MPKTPDEPQVERIAAQSPDLQAELRERLRVVVPEAFAEGKLDAGKLKALLGENGDAGPERYSFSWAGKRDAIAMLQLPTRATLAPDRDHSVNFDEAQHVFIEGENLEVLKVLYRSYFGRVKMIYIDPPYNTGNDFIYSDDFADPLDNYLRITGQKNGNGDYTTSQVDKNGRIHSAWLSMMYPRLALARQFLMERGVIFVSIDGAEVHNLILLMNEIFGEENQVGVVIWKGATDNNPTRIAIEHEYLLCYAKNLVALDAIWSNRSDVIKSLILERYAELKKHHKGDVEKIQQDIRRFITANREQLVPLTHYTRVDTDGVYTGSRKVHNPHPGGYRYDVIHPKTKKPCEPPVNGYRYPESTMKELLEKGKILFGDDETQIIQIKEYLHEYESKFSSLISIDSRSGSNEIKALFDDEKIFNNPKPTAFLKDFFGFIVAEGDLILDFFAGSGSSAHALIDMSRSLRVRLSTISVQLPEPVPGDSIAAKAGFKSISQIGLERLRKVLAQKRNTNGNGDAIAQGLRVFQLAESQLRSWTGVADKDADAVAAQIEAFADSLVPGWKPENVIWEVALREGYSLTSCIEKNPNTGKQNFWRVTDADREQSFVICLDDTLTLDAVRALKLPKNALFICRDTALDDTLSANLALQCRLKVL